MINTYNIALSSEIYSINSCREQNTCHNKASYLWLHSKAVYSGITIPLGLVVSFDNSMKRILADCTENSKPLKRKSYLFTLFPEHIVLKTFNSVYGKGHCSYRILPELLSEYNEESRKVE